MMIRSALVSITCEKYGTVFLYLGVGGTPNSIASTIAEAIQGGRRGLNSRLLLMKILSVTGKSRLDDSLFYFETESEIAHARHYDYRYEIEFRPMKATAVRIFEAAVPSDKLLFDGVIEAFLTSRFRLRRRPRGRTPLHYASREEYEEAYNSRPVSRPAQGTLVEQIMRDRARSKLPIPDTRGVRIISKEEHLARSKINARRRREK